MPKKPSSKSSVSKSSKSAAASGKTKRKTAASKSGTKKEPPINKMNDTVDQLKELGNNLERAADKGIYDSAGTYNASIAVIEPPSRERILS